MGLIVLYGPHVGEFKPAKEVKYGVSSFPSDAINCNAGTLIVVFKLHLKGLLKRTCQTKTR